MVAVCCLIQPQPTNKQPNSSPPMQPSLDRIDRRGARDAYVERVHEKMRLWLDKLEEDSANWIPEDRIDEVITEDLFAMRHPPHLEEWYDRLERRRLQFAERYVNTHTRPRTSASGSPSPHTRTALAPGGCTAPAMTLRPGQWAS